MSVKDSIISGIIQAEGGYINDPLDSGGETNFGITKAAAERYGYFGSIQAMPLLVAFNIYADKYWYSVNADKIEALSIDICREVVDTCVNLGPHRASEILQRALNVFNANETLYNNIVVDGDIGAKTINALSKYLEVRDEDVLLKALNCLQGAFYIDLAERRQKDEKFVYGWISKRVSI